MKYKLLLFISATRLAAYNVDEEGTVNAVSIYGNREMEYETLDGVEEFCKEIKNQYNVSDFSDIPMFITVINLGADMQFVENLIEEVKKAEGWNLIGAEKVLPVVALKESLLKNTQTVNVEVLSQRYTLHMDKNHVISCGKCEEADAVVPVSLEKFAVFERFNADGLQGNEDELEQFRKSTKKSQKIIKEQEQELNEMQKRIELVELKWTEAVEEINKLKKEKEIRKNRVLCRANFLGSNDGYYYLHGRFSNPKEESILLDYERKDGQLVKNGECVAYGKGNRRCYVKANAEGRIFYIHGSGKKIKDGDDLAIICDVSDTKEEALKWYFGKENL